MIICLSAGIEPSFFPPSRFRNPYIPESNTSLLVHQNSRVDVSHIFIVKYCLQNILSMFSIVPDLCCLGEDERGRWRVPSAAPWPCPVTNPVASTSRSPLGEHSALIEHTECLVHFLTTSCLLHQILPIFVPRCLSLCSRVPITQVTLKPEISLSPCFIYHESTVTWVTAHALPGDRAFTCK